MGWYGMVAVEAMAMGKPVVCFIRPDFESRLDACPIVRCTKETVADQLALPEGTVKSRINRGREELARLLLRAQQPGRRRLPRGRRGPEVR